MNEAFLLKSSIVVFSLHSSVNFLRMHWCFVKISSSRCLCLSFRQPFMKEFFVAQLLQVSWKVDRVTLNEF